MKNNLSRFEEYVLLEGPKIHGTFDPSMIMYRFEEQMTGKEYERVEGFLNWVHKNGLQYGHGNLHQRYSEFLSQKRTKRSTGKKLAAS